MQRLPSEASDSSGPALTAGHSIAAAWLLLASAAGVALAQWQPVDTDPTSPELVAPGSDGLWQSDRPPGGPFDRVRLHRFPATGAARAALLYLPGTNMNGVFNVDPEHDLARRIALGGVTVFTLDYRTRAVPPGGVTDFSFMQEWTLERFTADARAALTFVRSQSPDVPLFVAGFSRGAALATTLTCQAPGELRGLILLDGHLKNAKALEAPTALVGTLDQARREYLARGPAQMDVAAGIGWSDREVLMQTVAANPSAPATDGQSENLAQQLAGLLYAAWGPGRLAHPIGSPDGKGISRPEVLASLLEDYDRYYPAVQDVEGRLIASVADHPDTSLDDCWGELGVPLLWFGTTGMGNAWLLDGLSSAVHAGARTLEVHVLEGYGHLDILVSESSPEDVYRPTLEWLLRQVDQGTSVTQ